MKRSGPEWETGRVFRVVCERVEADAQPVEAGRSTAEPARIVVLKGEATRKTFVLGGERANIGRLAEVVDKDKQVVRRNHVVFTEREDGVNQTVSRAHAHIAVTAGGDYRLFDENSSYGTRIVRAGRTIALPAGSPRGTKLQPGDEIYFGQACVRFEMKA